MSDSNNMNSPRFSWHSSKEICKSLKSRFQNEMSKAEVKRSASSQIPQEDGKQVQILNAQDKNEFQIIHPPYDFRTLALLFENSNSLRQNVDAMAFNVDGSGWTFEPVMDFNSEDTNNKIQDFLFSKKVSESEISSKDLSLEQLQKLLATVEEVENEKERLKILSRIELLKANKIFEFINPEKTFTEIRKETRRDLEIFGNAGWEIIRDDLDSVTQIYYVPFVNIRLLPLTEPTTVTVKYKENDLSFSEVEVERRFRRFVQIGINKKTYYKQFGDPRIMSRKTGAFYKDIEQLKSKEGNNALPANEFYHWKISSPISPYGVPRWIGNLLSVLGSRSSEEVNWMYFENKSVPPLAVLVSGGRLESESVKSLESFVDNHIKGKKNFHKILILEALPADSDVVSAGDIENNGRCRIELKPLTDAQQNDALFANYDQTNRDKVGESFRIPPILRGDTDDFNRSTGQIAKANTEEQVFQPERDSFDEVINRFFLSDMGIKFWKFKSRAPVNRDPIVQTEIIATFLRSGAINPEDARPLIEDVLNIKLKKIDANWIKLPVELGRPMAQLGLLVDAIGMEPGDIGPNGESSNIEIEEEMDEIDDEMSEENTEKADLSTSSLNNGGLKSPSQGKLRRVPKKEIDILDLLERLKNKKLDVDLIKNIEDKYSKYDNNDEEETIILRVPKEQMESWIKKD